MIRRAHQSDNLTMPAQGMDVLATPGEGFAPFLDAEIGRWGRVVRENGIRLEG